MPRDGTATRTRILDAAEHLVKQHGYAATSVDQVLERSRSSKGAFFHHFPSKQELARALVDRYVEADLSMLEESLAATGHLTDPVERAIGIVHHFEELSEEMVGPTSNCLYIAVVSEQQLLDDDTGAEVQRAVTVWRHEIAAVLARALAARDRTDVDPEALADHLFVTFEGAFLLCRSTGDRGHMRRQLHAFRLMLEGLLAAQG